MLSKIQKKEIEKYINYWKEELFLCGWKFVIEYINEKVDTEGAVAECLPNYSYRSAVFKIYPHIFDDKEFCIKDIILHEVLHIILDPYKQMFDDMYKGKIVSIEEERKICETATSWIEQIISRKDKTK